MREVYGPSLQLLELLDIGLEGSWLTGQVPFCPTYTGLHLEYTHLFTTAAFLVQCHSYRPSLQANATLPSFTAAAWLFAYVASSKITHSTHSESQPTTARPVCSADRGVSCRCQRCC